jgi:hypothetical protein
MYLGSRDGRIGAIPAPAVGLAHGIMTWATIHHRWPAASPPFVPFGEVYRRLTEPRRLAVCHRSRRIRQAGDIHLLVATTFVMTRVNGTWPAFQRIARQEDLPSARIRFPKAGAPECDCCRRLERFLKARQSARICPIGGGSNLAGVLIVNERAFQDVLYGAPGNGSPFISPNKSQRRN